MQVWNLENDSTIAVVETAPSETWQGTSASALQLERHSVAQLRLPPPGPPASDGAPAQRKCAGSHSTWQGTTPHACLAQVCFHPSQDKMLIVAAGGSSNCVVVHDTDDSQVTQRFSLPEVRPALRSRLPPCTALGAVQA